MVSKFFQVLIFLNNDLEREIFSFDDFQSVEAINHFLDTANYTTEGVETYIGFALERLANVSESSFYENRTRLEVPDVLILITDTESSDDVANGAKVLSNLISALRGSYSMRGGNEW